MSDSGEKGEWISTYKGFFHEDRRHGIGMYTCKSGKKNHSYLGIWSCGKLWLIIKHLKQDVVRCCSLQQIMSQCQPSSADLAFLKSTTEHDTQTDDQAILPATLPKKIFVYSLCTLSSIPRKEFSVLSTQSTNVLSTQVKNTNLFFINGKTILPSGEENSPSFAQLFPENEVHDTIIIHFIRCPVCGKSADMRVREKKKPQETSIESLCCSSLSCEIQNTQCIYCKICAKNPHESCLPLYRFESGVKHMLSAHNIIVPFF
jgi:hypothetical protein